MGMALHAKGHPLEWWESWSATDTKRYRAGECAKKWATFDPGKAGGVGFGTVVELARRYGYDPQASNQNVFGWDDTGYVADDWGGRRGGGRAESESAAPTTAASSLPRFETMPDPNELKPLELDPAEMLRRQVAAMFRPGQHINIVREFWEKDGRRIPHGFGSTFWPDQLTHNASTVLDESDAEAGAFVRLNPITDMEERKSKNERQEQEPGGKVDKAYTDADVTAYENALVECDELPKERQLELIRRLRLPCACIVDSGNKSIHAVVRVDARDADEYARRVAALYDYCEANGLPVDRSCKNPSRLMRLAGAQRGDHLQKLIATYHGPRSWGEFVAEVREIAGEQRRQDAEKQPNDPTNGVVRIEDYEDEDIPAPEWVIPGLIQRKHVTLVVSTSNAGKSAFATRMAIACATGRDFLDGIRTVQCRAYIHDPEMTKDDIRRRIYDVREGMGVPKSELNGMLRFNSTRTKPVTLRGAINTLKELEADGERFGLVVFDSINALLGDVDENSSTSIRREVYVPLVQYAEEVNCAVLIIHHAGKGAPGDKQAGQMARGSSVWVDAADEVIELVGLYVKDGTGAHELLKHYAREVYDDMSQERTWMWPSALRMNMAKFRTSHKRPPIDLIFAYPNHIVDRTGELKECKPVSKRSPDPTAQEMGAEATRDRAERTRRESDSALYRIVSECENTGEAAGGETVAERFNEWRAGQDLPPQSFKTIQRYCREGRYQSVRWNTSRKQFELCDTDEHAA